MPMFPSSGQFYHVCMKDCVCVTVPVALGQACLAFLQVLVFLALHPGICEHLFSC